MKDFVRFSRSVPVRYAADIVVIGGGIAGVCAACAAAAEGYRVLLVERFGVVGGNATSGGVGAFCGETAGQGRIFDEIIARLHKFNAIAPYKSYPESEYRLFNHEILAFVLQEILHSYQVQTLLHARFVSCICERSQIKQAIICGSSGLEAVRADVFIDTSGEAVLVHEAGFETMKGRPEDGVQLPMSLFFFVRHLSDTKGTTRLPDDLLPTISCVKDLPMTSIWPNGPGANAVKIKIPHGDSTDTVSLTEAEIRARRKMMQVLDYYCRIEKKNWMLDHVASIIGIREGRRAVGMYILSVEDLRSGASFADAVARGVFYLDGHNPDDDKRTYILSPNELTVPPYQIPLRSLIVKGAENLLVAGRCLSTDQLALSSARVMTTCAMTGQAAGIAAAKAIENKCMVHQLDFVKVRKCVESYGAILTV